MYCTLKYFYFEFKSILYAQMFFAQTSQRRIVNVANDYFGVAPFF